MHNQFIHRASETNQCVDMISKIMPKQLQQQKTVLSLVEPMIH
jgi:hypothetical protein